MAPDRRKDLTLCLPITLLQLILILIFLHDPGGSILPGVGASSVYRECGGWLRERKGVIQSPNFPAAFPVPIECRWIIAAEPEKKIVLYFSQYFLKSNFRLQVRKQKQIKIISLIFCL